MIYALLMSFAFAGTIKVGVIDTGVAVLPSISRHYDGAYDVITDPHGTQVASIILYGPKSLSPTMVCDEVRLYSCNFQLGGILGCLKQFEGFDYINMSLEGPTPNDTERRLIKKFTSSGTVITVAAGNSGVDITKTKAYPASYMYEQGFNSNLRVISGGKYNYGPGVIYVSPHAVSFLPSGGVGNFSGSSAASAIYLHETLLKRCRDR